MNDFDDMEPPERAETIVDVEFWIEVYLTYAYIHPYENGFGLW